LLWVHGCSLNYMVKRVVSEDRPFRRAFARRISPPILLLY
jgi:hypothetical protein